MATCNMSTIDAIAWEEIVQRFLQVKHQVKDLLLQAPELNSENVSDETHGLISALRDKLERIEREIATVDEERRRNTS